MANKAFSELPSSAGLADGDLIAVTDDPAGTPASQAATAAQVAAYVQGKTADLTEATSIDETTDFLPARVGSNNRKVSPKTIFQSGNGLSLKPGLALADIIVALNSAASNAAVKTTVDGILIAAGEAETTTYPSDPLVMMIDDGNSDAISMPPQDMLKGLLLALSVFASTIAGADDLIIYYDQSAGALRAITPNKLGAGVYTIGIPAAALRPRQTSGPAALATTSGSSGQPDVPYLAFDGAAAEYATVGPFWMPKGWNAGPLKARFAGRRASGTGAANVVWAMRGLAIGDDESPAQNFGTAATVTAAMSTTTANFKFSGFTGDCTLAGSPAKGDLVFLEFYRDAAAGGDTLNSVDAWLSAVELLYTTDARDDA